MRRALPRLAALLAPAALILLLTAVPVWAAAPGPPPAVNDLATVINNLRYWVMSIIGGVATLFLCLGGFRYLMAGGDPSEIERAKTAFKSAAIGYALALLAPVILTILNSILVR
ncbi:pilin [Actinoplanes sp. Pm04-4]|uniref:Pilin n=1 Tax=Paractinoplanes pyxinae TaxID=2997416 RepID=A0ABT4BBX6_9ACTN|nr:pilin [Actinoplanes pyxinae]MCY1144029.1 pilin [Actinoplanes pyxinae]